MFIFQILQLLHAVFCYDDYCGFYKKIYHCTVINVCAFYDKFLRWLQNDVFSFSQGGGRLQVLPGLFQDLHFERTLELSYLSQLDYLSNNVCNECFILS